ncbi:putative transcription factor C2H2 family [Lupinus albus]|uniref:Putative transcription factor C2H2 family n=1 Tax=Lupinus albus TaxID=3870 RepID=A0A6A4PJ36_LUPAL|nr:putative transcription factor C2H2 family [Lupinus albus]
MGFYSEDTNTIISGLTIGQAIYEVALIIALLRWILCLIFKVMRDRNIDSLHTTTETEPSCMSSHVIRDNTLLLTTFGEIVEKLSEETQDTTTCAVCLNQLNMEDEVRELMNCYHAFHKECIDTWLDHDHDDNHNPTCPLCRAPLLTPCCFSSSESSTCVLPIHPSWVVERLLYLFGDDLLPC